MRIRYWSSDVCSSDLVYLFVDRDGRLRHPLAMARPRRNPDPTASMKRLIAVIERFCETHRMSESGFGRGFMKDSSFVGDLRRGRRVSLESEIGRAHVCTPVTNAHLVCRLLLE